MTKEEFIKQRCNIDNITLRQFEKEYRVVECNCGAPYCKGFRCLDLDGLLKENKQLKERIEYLERSNNRREDTILEQRQGISNLEDNWYKLKEYIEYELKTSFKSGSRFYYFSIIFEKMQELEQGSDSK